MTCRPGQTVLLAWLSAIPRRSPLTTLQGLVALAVRVAPVRRFVRTAWLAYILFLLRPTQRVENTLARRTHHLTPHTLHRVALPWIRYPSPYPRQHRTRQHLRQRKTGDQMGFAPAIQNGGRAHGVRYLECSSGLGGQVFRQYPVLQQLHEAGLAQAVAFTPADAALVVVVQLDVDPAGGGTRGRIGAIVRG